MLKPSFSGKSGKMKGFLLIRVFYKKAEGWGESELAQI
ncbi:hypothetical protein PEDI_36040 [Persicobacter diffluens]|uniref:Uncharacterized protein n=1 Tax=Persicobacter diffluens TaxID=981 RepID=A0AAN4W0V2_9BACT|nr:hypothetical protein PEDI_36040 [Persicobacter diffluens]